MMASQRQNDIELLVATEPDDLVKVFIVRGIVFLEEQEVPYEIERDGCDSAAIHILGQADGEPVAAGRITVHDEYAKLERIAVRKSYRGRNLGHRLTDFMISVAKERGLTKFKLHAQVYLTEFYRTHHFHVVGKTFKEAGIDHHLMIRHDSADLRES